MKFIFIKFPRWIWTLVFCLSFTTSFQLISEDQNFSENQISSSPSANNSSVVSGSESVPMEIPVNPESAQSTPENSSTEDPNGDSSVERQVAASPEAVRLARFKAAARKRLIQKLTNQDGSPARIFVLKPMDYTSLEAPNVVTETITRNLQLYDPKLQVKDAHYLLESVTLEQFRKAIAKLKADVIIITVMYPSNFDLYLYDRRVPYQIFAHTEPLPATSQYELTKDAAAYYTKLLVRRTLYRYIKNQYYELPRDNSPPILKAEIPRYIASPQSVEKVNREMRSNFFASVGAGAALSSGARGSLWNSNLIGFEVGFNVWDRLYTVVGADLFAYNAALGGLKYILSNKQETFKLAFGLGGAVVTDRKSFNWDQSDAIQSGERFIVPSASILFPIVDIYLKADMQAFIGIDKKSYVFTLLPGILFMF